MKKQEKGGRAIWHFVSAVPSITSVRFSHLPNLVVNVLRKFLNQKQKSNLTFPYSFVFIDLDKKSLVHCFNSPRFVLSNMGNDSKCKSLCPFSLKIRP